MRKICLHSKHSLILLWGLPKKRIKYIVQFNNVFKLAIRETFYNNAEDYDYEESL